MIKISINYQKLNKICDKIILFLITRYAYKGYCYYVESDEDRPSIIPFTYFKFKTFEEWKIRFSYMIYIERVLKIRVDKGQAFLPYQYNYEILKWLWIQTKHFLKSITPQQLR